MDSDHEEMSFLVEDTFSVVVAADETLAPCAAIALVLSSDFTAPTKLAMAWNAEEAENRPMTPADRGLGAADTAASVGPPDEAVLGPRGVDIGGFRDDDDAAAWPNEKLTSPKVGTEVATIEEGC